ncbi:MAG: bifunctional phosphopantothenoylcysteine decarboxylase/phosphopantothenate--cysteine ligase CoaBC [Rhodospirillaceae bacterium]|nr:bifunctional phosphopantothenoylcysteine decarboxylase/phosphopantothenate--cysteine ligase CoaBC [Rhodospirillaceae bacterium]MBT4426890.1 bifunctional phosphopantothenoylcysteine decarboxylase/phosphopantothenate--cysteine ligase CoaBC [Rhodospirillaceae bacterium]MBT5039596.1 bifunctional phosphopantothenoylcysteine decarboxylase/phosphopantothenate--cysteine ligase CoaBC [Rhodospirillaceae bacterium]MBT5780001.1 bifunctional phosphopantothenoylcysteine decarboxylase/phosphopantothenate--c
MRVLLIISGGIAAYKSLELIRGLRRHGAQVRPILTKGGAQFVTPLSVSALAQEKVYDDLFSLTDESEIGHIRLARETDLVVVAPATADILAKMANGIADDLATTALLATDRPILVAPAMNSRMWAQASTMRNMELLKANGVMTVGPAHGELAEGEIGIGRMAEPADILAAIEAALGGPLTGVRALVTSGPTHEPIDPVRYIANRSSGKQGHAIAGACARLGAAVTLVSGPSNEADPPGVETVHVETARDMLDACLQALPVDVAICAAAVSDWRPAEAETQKIKKGRRTNATSPNLELVENPDILATLGARENDRPRLVIGFAAETDDVVAYAAAKLASKGCDWILANDVSPHTGTFGGDDNKVHLISRTADAPRIEEWPEASKVEVAARLAERIAETLGSAA